MLGLISEPAVHSSFPLQHAQTRHWTLVPAGVVVWLRSCSARPTRSRRLFLLYKTEVACVLESTTITEHFLPSPYKAHYLVLPSPLAPSPFPVSPVTSSPVSIRVAVRQRASTPRLFDVHFSLCSRSFRSHLPLLTRHRLCSMQSNNKEGSASSSLASPDATLRSGCTHTFAGQPVSPFPLSFSLCVSHVLCGTPHLIPPLFRLS